MPDDQQTAATARGDAELMREYLAERDVPCPRCGYNLRALLSKRCPECGEPLVLHVGLVHPQLGLYLAAVVGLAAGAGFSGFCVGVLVIDLLFCGLDWSRYRDLFLIDVFPALAVESFALLAVLCFSRQIRRCSAGERITFAVGCWLLTLGNLVYFAILWG